MEPYHCFLKRKAQDVAEFISTMIGSLHLRQNVFAVFGDEYMIPIQIQA